MEWIELMGGGVNGYTSWMCSRWGWSEWTHIAERIVKIMQPMGVG